MDALGPGDRYLAGHDLGTDRNPSRHDIADIAGIAGEDAAFWAGESKLRSASRNSLAVCARFISSSARPVPSSSRRPVQASA